MALGHPGLATDLGPLALQASNPTSSADPHKTNAARRQRWNCRMIR